MRIRLVSLACCIAALAGMAGCTPTVGNTLDWQEKSFRKVTPNAPRYAEERLAFASSADANGLMAEGVVQQFAVEVRGFPEQGTVSLRCLAGFRAAVWFRGFDPGKLKIVSASLTDNRGHKFKLAQVSPTYGCAAEMLVDQKQNAAWMEFNNRDYFMILTVNFTYDGQTMTAFFPKIYCVFDKYRGT